ncbi:MAG TPA: RNA polymerase sigma factor [Saprospiraceae bacterium]|nr:RNA polymerase sigma factor [Saprospiraceae bacterium]
MRTLEYKEELVSKLIKGERSAQFTFYKTYADAMYNVSVRIVNNHDEAQDILQKSFMDAFNNIHTYNGSSTPGAWLKRIVINNSIDYLRKQKPVFQEIDHTIISLPDEENDEVDVRYQVDKVRRAIELLPDGYRTVLSLYLLEGYDHQEIGEILNITESTSKSQYSRAKLKLKELLKESHYSTT